MKYIIDVPADLYVINGELHIPWRFGENQARNLLNTGIEAKPYKAEPKSECDGCADCRYTDREEWEEPCRRCCNSYCSMWKEKDE